MPGYTRAELTAELSVVPDKRGERSPEEQFDAAKKAAAGTEIAREGGPDSIVLSGGRAEVLDAARKVLEAALEAGVKSISLEVEAERDADRFGGAD